MESLNISSHIDKESGWGGGRGRSTGKKGSSSSSSTEELGHSCPGIAGVPQKGRDSSFPECSVDIDLEGGEDKSRLHSMKLERDCRICHLTLDASNQESGFPIELGCELLLTNYVPRLGSKLREIGHVKYVDRLHEMFLDQMRPKCQSRWDEENVAVVVASIPSRLGEAPRYFWQGHRFLNFLLACMVFAFVISWLFHFNVPS